MDTEDASRNNGKKTGPGHPPVEHQFKPGNPGRPKGSRNALGEAFLEAMHDDFKAHGVEAIQKVRGDKPDQYLKVIASILPKDLNVNINNMDDLSDDELRARIRSLESVIRPFLADEGISGPPVGDGPTTAH
jgi:hypothetical protein